MNEIWAACPEPEQLPHWFAEVSGDLHVDGQAFIDFDNGEHTPLVIRECEPPRLLVADWAFGDDAISTLRVELSDADDRQDDFGARALQLAQLDGRRLRGGLARLPRPIG